MTNWIQEQLAFRRLKKKLRAHTQIDRGFFASARESFVALIQTKGTATASVRGSSFVWRYATVTIVAILALTSGVGVFAEKLDVPATSPLYPVKRIVERVQLAVSSPAQQVILHQEYAQKRAKEIAALAIEDTSQHDGSPELSTSLQSKEIRRTEISIATSVPRVARSVPVRKNLISSVSFETASESFKNTKEYQRKKEQIEQLKNDLEEEAQSAVSQSQELNLSDHDQVRICRTVVDSLRQSSASSSERLADKIQSRCPEPSRDNN